MKNLILCVMLVVCVGCKENAYSNQEIKRDIPKEAQNFENLGNDWYSFELDGKKFLYYRSFKASAVTQVQ